MASLADMLRNGGPPPSPDMPPEMVEGGPAPETGAEMSPEQAVAFMESKGLTPNDLPMLIAAIEAIMAAQGGGGGAPPDMPPEM